VQVAEAADALQSVVVEARFFPVVCRVRERQAEVLQRLAAPALEQLHPGQADVGVGVLLFVK